MSEHFDELTAPQPPMRVVNTSPKKMNEPRISPAMEDALEAFVNTECTITDAAEDAGLTREHLSKSLRKPHIQDFVMQLLRAKLVQHGAKAVEALSRNLNAKSGYVQVMAASQLLDRAGMDAKTAQGLHRDVGEISIHIDLSGN